MTDGTPEGAGRSIVERAKAIILKPKDEWPVIDRETTSSGDIFTRYAVPLAAIGPVALLIGSQLFGYGAFGITYRPSLMSSLSLAITSFVLGLIGLFALSFVADKLAPNFGGASSSRNAFKLVAYSMTASWLAGFFSIVPSLGFLGLLGLYSFYLFYTGAMPLMKVPVDKALTYTIVTAICMIVIYVCIGALTSAIGGLFGASPLSVMGGGTVTSSDGGSVSVPGVGTLDTGKIQQATKDLEAAANGKSQAVAPDALQALLPGAIGGYQRTAVESQRVGPASNAEGTYEASGKSFKLKVSDMTVVGAIAGMATAFGVEQNREDGDSYEHTTTKDGNLTIEKWDRGDSSGTFSTMVGKRFMIEAEGEAGSIDELKAAVATIDLGKLASLAKS
ncbi:Yip1 family protein [Sphingobium nicotianae]|uniref:YIP1 family protein n=1 Tax=Sphingobium nicotianae TaxID=2782607 RepID=A0A9X1AJQ4_9SPHN|nr:Yip1 family protein [Sphingobium nicotianae]MBT2185754.1 YIP1 family protein [Sphingobium nicotianae]